MPGGQGRFRFLPLGPLATPVTPLKRSLREGVRHCTPCLYCNLSRPRLRGRCRGVSRDGRGITCGTWHLRAVPLSATHFVRVHFPRLRGQLWVSAITSLPVEGGGCECNEQTEGLHRGCSYLRQPLSLTALVSPLPSSAIPAAAVAARGLLLDGRYRLRRGCGLLIAHIWAGHERLRICVRRGKKAVCALKQGAAYVAFRLRFAVLGAVLHGCRPILLLRRSWLSGADRRQ